jgi:hypothetical protein
MLLEISMFMDILFALLPVKNLLRELIPQKSETKFKKCISMKKVQETRFNVLEIAYYRQM